MESKEYSPEEKHDMDISRTQSEAELLRDGAVRLDDGRIEVSEDQNNEIYQEEREVNVGLNNFDFVILKSTLEAAREQYFPNLSNLNDEMKRELSHLNSLIAKLERGQSVLTEETLNRQEEIYGSEDNQ